MQMQKTNITCQQYLYNKQAFKTVTKRLNKHWKAKKITHYMDMQVSKM